eukprot:CAMPEP_0179315546 /NCGR_PEP_ID=MMETSP0797-20121207/55130_1 /TAXON_ID=47934 /ORGANISM="Dinophysis acuminata, Strain DAEP01" /LENGTH=463 /DNA_ID=CAMNT_0021026099 /DNA_START=72 /DNA_END=1460 /DNA_ORIENTATION=+
MPVEEYFAEHLEPILGRLTADWMAAESLGVHPENVVSFVHSWVGQQLREGDGGLRPSKLPLSHMSAWCQQVRGQDRERGRGALCRRLAILEEALSRTALGRCALMAVEAEDRDALASILAASGLGYDPAAAPERQLSSASSACLPGFAAGGPNEAGCHHAMGDTTRADALEALGVVLHALRARGITSASAAFAHFRPDSSWCLERGGLAREIQRLDLLPPERVARLVEVLDDDGSGWIKYCNFRCAVAELLSGGHDSQPVLSDDELNAVMRRIQDRLQLQRRTVREAFREWDDPAGAGALNCHDFAARLQSLRLGLSGKEITQVLNTLSTCSHGSSPVHNGSVLLADFQAFAERGARQSCLREWAHRGFEQLRETLTRAAIESTIKRHADAPGHQHLGFGRFTQMVRGTDPSLSPRDIHRLWCVLGKKDLTEESLVEVEELLRWMGSDATPGTVPGPSADRSS